MPLYEFYCEDCNDTFDSIENMGTKYIMCFCGSKAYKIMSVPNFKINGYSESNGYSKETKKKKK